MIYKAVEDKIIMTEQESFNIEQILECGQCFRFEKLGEMYYKIVACKKELFIRQTADRVEFFPCDKYDFENIWIEYFDLNRDYQKIKNTLSKRDSVLAEAIKYGSGIRLLNQEPWECLLSFIISQNNNIPRIKGIIRAMADTYGENGAFPTLEEIEKATVDELFELRMGFRAKYIYDAIQKVKSGKVDLEALFEINAEEAREKLMLIKGVGPKVADCVLLFSLKKKEVFPTDVWVKRVMSYFYFNNEETDINAIHKYASKNWGEYAGFAQQYLFYYARSLKIGTK